MIRKQPTDRVKDFNIILDDLPITKMSSNTEYAASMEAKQIAQQLTALKASLTNIKYRTSKANRDLYVRHTARVTAPIEASLPQNRTSAPPAIRPISDTIRRDPTRLENNSLDIIT